MFWCFCLAMSPVPRFFAFFGHIFCCVVSYRRIFISLFTFLKNVSSVFPSFLLKILLLSTAFYSSFLPSILATSLLAFLPLIFPLLILFSYFPSILPSSPLPFFLFSLSFLPYFANLPFQSYNYIIFILSNPFFHLYHCFRCFY